MKERYLHSVRILMDCSPEEKERLLSRLSNALAAYFEDVPDADEKALIANFGTPEECAARLLDECTPTTVAIERQKKSRKHRVLMTILAVLLVITTGVALYLWSNGGLVIISTYHNVPPDYWDTIPSNHVIYAYDD